MDYLKLFQTHEEYETFVSGGTMVKPNVSHCVSENEVHYNPWTDQRLTVKYNVIDASNPTQLYTYMSQEGKTVNGALMFDKVVIDGTEVSISDLDAASGKTQLSVGEHTAKYTLKDPTIIGAYGDASDPLSVKFGATFFSCENVISVEIPNGVTTIGNYAFAYCSSLTSVTIPNSVATIGEGAFGYCSGLTSVTIPSSVTSIGNYAFQSCSGLTSVIIPNSVTTIGYSAFQECTSLTSVTIGNSVTSIGEEAFESCSGLTSVIIPNSVTTIENYAFYNCMGLGSVTVEATTPPSLGQRAFHKAEIEDEGSSPLNISIYVPSESVETYKVASGWSSYASKINAIQ